jgi:PEP-CTERM motif-containing protein
VAQAPVKRHTVAVFLLVLCAALRTADAQVILTGNNFSASNFDAIGVSPFDPALGTLNSVNVTINGRLTVTGNTSPWFVQSGFALVPQPHAYFVSVTQDFFGLIGKYFEFDGNALFAFQGLATGQGEAFAFVTDFTYGFTFTAATDLAGGISPSFSNTSGTLTPPTGVSGLRADFHKTIAPIDEIDIVQTWSGLTIAPTPLTIGSVLTQGALLLQYNYTPTAIPEPQTYAMLMAGVALLGFVARRRSFRLR